ncbi:MaoC family dehydratase N-terminal domain-containing protein [Mesorhizobium sp. LHD-90]|uniref:FAS1-like dehydratase domain-containing protein n=1 Tax=Mesorhizobium sp. LHD-90 TaxID=3071414 RepID=UPI0027E05DB4|nr:MaoC family dehydratase N-terminal domain-containing protein [Mesorhizobium sp. LHD-90]MDQ6434522.1 MaoC family dehydratase N-terminal domain-containing protein [Mesorhizobium sp. LHD-90]
MPEDIEKPFADWIGRASESEDVLTERLAASFRAIFGQHLAPVAEGAAPLGIHWCLSPAIATMAELGPDGHPAKNRDLPPVPQPRRMWAGGSIETLGALRIGDRIRRRSTIADVTHKTGRSGELWFVAVEHVYSSERGAAIRERHDIVYREAAKPAPGRPATAGVQPAARPHSRSLSAPTSPVLLFRYSAITFNGHRIHYDLPYATEVEGYAGLVVHGPIQATLLFNLAATAIGAPPRKFDYRGLSPAIAGPDIFVRQGAGAEAGTYWTQGQSGAIHMEATAKP